MTNYFHYNGHKGKRYFKVIEPGLDKPISHSKVIMVTESAGEVKKGRAHTLGVSQISFLTFAGNYNYNNSSMSITKQTYDKAFNDIITRLTDDTA